MLGQVGTFDVKIKHKPTLPYLLQTLSAGILYVKIRTDKGDTSRKIIIN
jgi:hypothetical protein